MIPMVAVLCLFVLPVCKAGHAPVSDTLPAELFTLLSAAGMAEPEAVAREERPYNGHITVIFYLYAVQCATSRQKPPKSQTGLLLGMYVRKVVCCIDTSR